MAGTETLTLTLGRGSDIACEGERGFSEFGVGMEECGIRVFGFRLRILIEAQVVLSSEPM